VDDVGAEHGDRAGSDPFAAVLEVLDDVAGEQHAGRVEPQRLDDGRAEQRQASHLVRVGGLASGRREHLLADPRLERQVAAERVERPPEGRARRVVAGGDEADDLVADLQVGQGVAVLGGRRGQPGEDGGDALAPPGAFDLRVDQGVDPVAGGHRPPPARRAQPFVRGGHLRQQGCELEERLEVLAQPVGVPGQPFAEERADGGAAQRGAQQGEAVEGGAPGRRRQRGLGGVGHDRQVVGDPPRGQRRPDEGAAPGVVRAVGDDERGLAVDRDEHLEGLPPPEELVVREDELAGLRAEQVGVALPAEHPEGDLAPVPPGSPEHLAGTVGDRPHVPILTRRRNQHGPGHVRGRNGPDKGVADEEDAMRRRAVVAASGLVVAGLVLVGCGFGDAGPAGSDVDPPLEMVIDCWGLG
jgi:hypothetical protein